MYKKQSQSWLKHIDFIILDAFMLQLAFVLAYVIRHGWSLPYGNETYRTLAVIITLIDFIIAAFFNTMHNVLKRGLYLEFVNTVAHVFLVTATLSVYLFLVKHGTDYSRIAILLTAAFHVIGGYITRLLWKKELNAIGYRRPKQNMILVSAESRVREIISNISPLDEYSISGLVLSDRNAKGETIEGIPVVANLSDAADYICREWVDEVLVCEENLNEIKDIRLTEDTDAINTSKACAYSAAGKKTEVFAAGTNTETTAAGTGKETTATAINTETTTAGSSSDKPKNSTETLIEQCRQMAVPVHIRLPLQNLGRKAFIQKMYGSYVITTTTNYASSKELMAKRMIDVFGALIGSVFAILLIVIIGPVIKLQSPGPIIFTQTRIGQNGKKFKIFKLRTMYTDAEARKKEYLSQNRVHDGMMFKLDFDPRIIGNKVVDGKKVTGLGEFLRRTSLDEFPQFFNVLLNQMSLVGTRPPTEDEWERYKYHHRARLATKPGITGLWQTSGRSEITDFEEVVKLDTEYINSWSIGLDLKILVKTVIAVFTRNGAM